MIKRMLIACACLFCFTVNSFSEYNSNDTHKLIGLVDKATGKGIPDARAIFLMRSEIIDFVSTSGVANANYVIVTFAPTNYTAISSNVESHLIGIDSVLGSINLDRNIYTSKFYSITSSNVDWLTISSNSGPNATLTLSQRMIDALAKSEMSLSEMDAQSIYLSKASASNDYFQLPGGGVLSTNGRIAGQTVKFKGFDLQGKPNYTHEWSSVNTIIAGGVTNHPVDILELESDTIQFEHVQSNDPSSRSKLKLIAQLGDVTVLDFKWKGAYNFDTTYTTNDVVGFDNSAWIALQTFRNKTPGTDSVATQYWNVVAYKGLNGGDGLGELVYKDEWFNLAEYQVNDMVRYQGILYICLELNMSTIPSENPTIWKQFLFDGRDGEDGADGNDGFNGGDGIGNIVYKFEFEILRSYDTNDMVTSEGQTYVSKVNGNIGHIPKYSPNYWQLFVSKGNDGATSISNLTFVGEYVGGRFYPSNCVVTSSRSAYYAKHDIQANENKPPIDVLLSPNGNVDWGLVASRGFDGEDGANGSVWNFRDVYNAEYSYDVYDMVTSGGDLYVAVGPVPKLSPPIYISTYPWKRIIRSGIDGAPGANLVFRGPWQLDYQYETNDLVWTDLGTWYAIQPSIGVVPREPSYHWRSFVRAGADGIGGIKFYGQWREGVQVTTNDVVSTEDGQMWVPKVDYPQSYPSSMEWILVVGHGPDGLPGPQGVVGPTGPRGEPGLGNLVSMGEFNYNSTYMTNHIVSFQGSLFYPKLDYVTTIYPTNSLYWFQFVRAGRDGTNGYNGFMNVLFKGPYSGAVNYTTNDVVSYDNELYIVTNETPTIGINPSFEEYWYLFLAKGVVGSQGLRGVQGAVGERGAPGANLSFIGTWYSLTEYDQYQLVSYNGATFYSKSSANLNNTPAINSPYWDLFVDRGGDGPTGPTGSPGIAGPPGLNLTYFGNWSSNIEYQISNLVTYAGSAYYSISNNNSNHVPSTNSIYWSVFAQKGDQGIQGYMGPAGATGIQGVPGAALSLIGTWTNTYNYSSSNLVSYLGSTYYSSVNNNSNNIPATNSSYWSVFTLKGDTGSQGSQGIQGVQGIQGIQGNNGSDLAFIGTWNSGTSYSASNLVAYLGSTYYSINDSNLNNIPATNSIHWGVFTLKGDTGSQGIQGIQGAQGIQGIQGNQGTAGAALSLIGVWNSGTSYSASNLVTYLGSTFYSVNDSNLNNIPATNSSYWSVFTLKGDTGAQGIQGIQGVQGIQGIQGTAGAALSLTGPWDSGTSYNASNLVTYLGSTYYSVNNSNLNNIPATNSIHWNVFAQKGDQGIQGIQGIEGHVNALSGIAESTNLITTVSQTLNTKTNILATFYQSVGEIAQIEIIDARTNGFDFQIRTTESVTTNRIKISWMAIE